jgi:hypothetical protein
LSTLKDSLCSFTNVDAQPNLCIKGEIFPQIYLFIYEHHQLGSSRGFPSRESISKTEGNKNNKKTDK